jgi:hypothetical protein
VSDERELTVDELDIEEGLQWLMFLSGAALMALSPDKRTFGAAKETAGEAYWRHIPLQKALSDLAHEHPGRLRQLWAKALQEPMPFGGAPLGMPKVPKAKPTP